MEKRSKLFKNPIKIQRGQLLQRAILKSDPPSQFKYRDRLTIIIDILKAVKNSGKGRKKTQIMQSANLNYAQMKKYLNYLMDCGLVKATKKQTYRLTSKGSEFLYSLDIRRNISLM